MKGMSSMGALRKYGKAPFSVAVVHGGPGAAGEMAPVALRLASGRGILEPLQRADSLEGQVEELRTALEQDGTPPITLIGFSWGAWLSLIIAARYPKLVKKLILIGCGGIEERNAEETQGTRLDRLSAQEKEEVSSLTDILGNPTATEKDAAFARLGALFSKTDTYDPIALTPHDDGPIDYRVDIFLSVWKDAAKLRRSGRLQELVKSVRCPVTAIHGDYDPHPADGVKKTLSASLETFRFILLEKCGHAPWRESSASGPFFRILEEELSEAVT
jgi:pimeloyl-ACP methyl ester carboxylesterase